MKILIPYTANVPVSFRLTGCDVASSVLSQYEFTDPILRKTNVPVLFSLDDCSVASSLYHTVSLLLLHDNQHWDIARLSLLYEN